VTPGQGARHLRPRGEGNEQPITTVELFALVYVFAVTQLSHLTLDDLTVAAVGRAALLLLIVWWAWIYTTWMANWFDPGSPAVRGVLAGVMLVSLLGRDQPLRDANTYMPGESLFRLRVTGAANAKRLAVAAILVLLAAVGSQISALVLSATVAALLSGLALWELCAPAHGVFLRHLQQHQQEGTT
jgi:low temperature requirement protein LtrA